MRQLQQWLRIATPPIVSFLALAVVLEVVVRLTGVKAYLVPPPSSVLRVALVAGDDSADLWTGLWQTSYASLAGFAASALIGTAIAIALSLSKWIQRAFYPYAVFFQTVPIIAIAPLLVIWLGYGINTVIASAFIVSVFPMIANTLAGLLAVDPALRDLFALCRAGSLVTMLKLKLPSALPNIFTGLRIAAGLAVIGAIVGEFIAGGGLGVIIVTAIRVQRTDKVLAAVLLASLLGLAMFAVVNLAAHLALRHWHASEQQRA